MWIGSDGGHTDYRSSRRVFRREVRTEDTRGDGEDVLRSRVIG